MPMSVACPSCKSKLKIPDAMIGMDRTLNCPACKTPLNVRQLTTPSAGSAAAQAPAPATTNPTVSAPPSPPIKESAFDDLDLMPEHKPASSPQPTALAPAATAPLPASTETDSGAYDDLDLMPENKPAAPAPKEEVYEEFEVVEDDEAKDVEPIEELEALEEVEAVEEVHAVEEVEAVEEVHAVEEVESVDRLETVDDEDSKKKKKRIADEEKPKAKPKPAPTSATDKAPAAKSDKSLFTALNLLKIRAGMSLEEVEAILGPGTVIDRLVIGNNERKIVLWLDGKGRGFQTTFVNDKNSFGF